MAKISTYVDTPWLTNVSHGPSIITYTEMPHKMTSPQLETNSSINFCFLFQRLLAHLSLASFSRAHTWEDGAQLRSLRGLSLSSCPGTAVGFLFHCPFLGVAVLFCFLNSASRRPTRCVSLKKEVDPPATVSDLPHSPKHVCCLTVGFSNSSKPVYNYQSWCHLYTELESCKRFSNMKYCTRI